MKRIRIFKLALFGATVACVSLVPAIPSAVAQEQQAALLPPSKFDGLYSVEVVTKDGTCATSHWSVAVARGQIASVSPNTTNITASGLVESDGVVSMTFRNGQNQIAHVGGAIKGRRGTGSWSSPTALCGGIWRAEKEK